MRSKPAEAPVHADEQDARTEFSPETLRVAAEALKNVAMTSGEISAVTSVELRTLAAHLLCLASTVDGGG